MLAPRSEETLGPLFKSNTRHSCASTHDIEEDMQVTPVSEEAVIEFLRSIIDGGNTTASAPTFPASDRSYLAQLGGGLAARISPPNHVPASTLQTAPRSTLRTSMEEGEIYDPTLQDQYRRHLSSIVLMNLDRRQATQDHEEGETRDENRRLAVEKAFTTADCEHFAFLNKRVGTELVDRAGRKKVNAGENGDRKRSALSELQFANLDQRGDSISTLSTTITTPSSNAETISITRPAESGPVSDINARSPSLQASTRNDLETSVSLLAPPIRIGHDELTCNEPPAYKDLGFRYPPPQAPSHKRNQLRNRNHSSTRSASPRPLSDRSFDTPRRFSAYTMPKRRRYSIDYDDYRRSPYRGVKRLRRDNDGPSYGEPSPPPARFRSRSSSPISPRSPRPVHRLPGRSYRDEAKELAETRKHTYRGRSRTPPRRSPHWNNPCSQRSSPYQPYRDDEPRRRRSLSPANDPTESRAHELPRLILITEGTPPKPSPTNPDEPSSAVSTTPTAVEINPYGSLPLPVPGLWVAERGLPNVAILPLEFTLNPEASKQLCISSQFSSSASLPFRLELICMRSDTATKIMGAAATDWTSVSALVTDLLSTRMEWPQRGDLIVEINKGTPWHKAWMPQDLGPNAPPLDLTQFVREDLNCVRLIQLGDMSMFAFLLVASIAPERANPSVNIAKILLSQSKCGVLTLPTGAGSS